MKWLEKENFNSIVLGFFWRHWVHIILESTTLMKHPETNTLKWLSSTLSLWCEGDRCYEWARKKRNTDVYKWNSPKIRQIFIMNLQKKQINELYDTIYHICVGHLHRSSRIRVSAPLPLSPFYTDPQNSTRESKLLRWSLLDIPPFICCLPLQFFLHFFPPPRSSFTSHISMQTLFVSMPILQTNKLKPKAYKLQPSVSTDS